jgi:hypothetical protein
MSVIVGMLDFSLVECMVACSGVLLIGMYRVRGHKISIDIESYGIKPRESLNNLTFP